MCCQELFKFIFMGGLGFAPNILTYSPRLKVGDSGINKDRTSHDGLTSSTPTDNALPTFMFFMLTKFLNLRA